MRPPVVYMSQNPADPTDVTYNALVRLNRPVPHQSPHIQATLTVGGAAPSGELLRYGRRRRACYTGLIDLPARELPDPQVGQTANLRLKISGVKETLLKRVPLRDYSRSAPAQRCGKDSLDTQD